MEKLYLLTLDKKFLGIKHKMNSKELQGIMTQHNVTQQQVDEDIKKRVYHAFLQSMGKRLPITVDTKEDSVDYELSGFVLSQREMMETIMECLEMDDKGREMAIETIKKYLGIYA
jgi:hypothetical protein